MYYVYIIKSTQNPKMIYTGSTKDLRKRMAAHNSGKSWHTKQYKPWKLIFYSAFADKRKADAFEKYLKTASGRAFKQKRFI